MAMFHEYTSYDACGLAELVRSRQVSALDLLEAAIARLESVNPRINAVVHRFFDRAQKQLNSPLPEGPFQGVPFLLKDLLQAYDGTPLTQGSRYYRHCQPAHRGELTQRFLKSGVLILGRTNTSEFGLLPFVEPELYGPTRNPWNLDHSPGGSSGGSGAAVAAGIVPMAHGGDGGGSIRIPASCNGLFGLKPSRGRVPLGPDFSLVWQGFAIEHVLTRSVRDSATMLDATHGMDVGAPYAAPTPTMSFRAALDEAPKKLRVGLCLHPMLGNQIDQECKEATYNTGKMLESLGHSVEEFQPTGIDFEKLRNSFLMILAAETAVSVFHGAQLTGRAATANEFELATWMFAKIGRGLGGDMIASAIADVYQISRAVGQWFEKMDVLLTPTLARPPIKVGELQPKRIERIIMELARRLPLGAIVKAMIPTIAARSFDWIAFTPLANMTGQPSASLPLHQSSTGLPIGTMLTTRYGDEITLLQVSKQLEELHPWIHRHAIV